jgi:hypothetical protein
MTQMCLCDVAGTADDVAVDIAVGWNGVLSFEVLLCDTGSEGGVGGNAAGEVEESIIVGWLAAYNPPVYDVTGTQGC